MCQGQHRATQASKDKLAQDTLQDNQTVRVGRHVWRSLEGRTEALERYSADYEWDLH